MSDKIKINYLENRIKELEKQNRELKINLRESEKKCRLLLEGMRENFNDECHKY